MSRIKTILYTLLSFAGTVLLVFLVSLVPWTKELFSEVFGWTLILTINFIAAGCIYSGIRNWNNWFDDPYLKLAIGAIILVVEGIIFGIYFS